ncbi:unnamed protein product, partial [Iphiclides podalirius]
MAVLGVLIGSQFPGPRSESLRKEFQVPALNRGRTTKCASSGGTEKLVGCQYDSNIFEAASTTRPEYERAPLYPKN